MTETNLKNPNPHGNLFSKNVEQTPNFKINKFIRLLFEVHIGYELGFIILNPLGVLIPWKFDFLGGFNLMGVLIPWV